MSMRCVALALGAGLVSATVQAAPPRATGSRGATGARPARSTAARAHDHGQARSALPALTRRAPAATADPAKRASIQHGTAGTAAYGQGRYADAIAEYQQAIKLWPDNHVAYYGMAGAYAQLQDWPRASAAIAEAAAIAPDAAMYQLFHGRFAYEAAVADARRDLAHRTGQRPEDVTPDRRPEALIAGHAS